MGTGCQQGLLLASRWWAGLPHWAGADAIDLDGIELGSSSVGPVDRTEVGFLGCIISLEDGVDPRRKVLHLELWVKVRILHCTTSESSVILVLLCYKRRMQQKGQQGKDRINNRAINSLKVAMEWGLCR